MNVTPELINRVVHDVLQALQQRGDRGSSTGVTSTAKASPVETSLPESVAASALDLTSQAVVTESVIAGSWTNQTLLNVAPKTIVTPSAQDFIRDRGLKLHRAAHESLTKSTVGWQLLGRPGLGWGAQGGGVELPVGWSQSLGATLEENIANSATAISRGEIHGAIIPSSRPHAAVCLANRHRKLRAGLVHTAADVLALSAELGANLYVVDDRQLTRFGLLNIVRTISRQPAPAAPAGWTE